MGSVCIFYLQPLKKGLFTPPLIHGMVRMMIKYRLTLYNLKGVIMNKRNIRVLVVPLLISLCCNNSYAWNENNSSFQNFVTGACAVGAAVLGAVSAVALADWCFSESDEQLIIRLDRECSHFDHQYNEMMNYLEQSLGVYSFPVDALTLYRHCPEAVHYEVALRIMQNGIAHDTYRGNVSAATKQLRSTMNTLRKRIHVLERNVLSYDEQRKLQVMRDLCYRADKLINHATFFADYLEHHKSYFKVYDLVMVLRDSYAVCFVIAEEAGMYAESNLKNGIISAYGGRYPFRSFIHVIEQDITKLRSGINALAYNYHDGRRYANNMLNQMIWMKSVVMADYRYTQECYQWEQEHLRRLHIEALETQARIERERVNALREQNRILAANLAEDLCHHKMYGCNYDPEIDVQVTVIM